MEGSTWRVRNIRVTRRDGHRHGIARQQRPLRLFAIHILLMGSYDATNYRQVGQFILDVLNRAFSYLRSVRTVNPPSPARAFIRVGVLVPARPAVSWGASCCVCISGGSCTFFLLIGLFGRLPVIANVFVHHGDTTLHRRHVPRLPLHPADSAYRYHSRSLARPQILP